MRNVDLQTFNQKNYEYHCSKCLRILICSLIYMTKLFVLVWRTIARNGFHEVFRFEIFVLVFFSIACTEPEHLYLLSLARTVKIDQSFHYLSDL